MCRLLVVAVLLTVSSVATGEEQVFGSIDEFLAQNFKEVPAPQTLWVRGALRQQLERILGERVGLRLQHWSADGVSVWVLNRIGKDRPITTAFAVGDGVIDDVRVLIYRESRGWEVKHKFFTDQLIGAKLNPRGNLSQNVDNITGATLSVNAMKRMARAALTLHEHRTPQTTQDS